MSNSMSIPALKIIGTISLGILTGTLISTPLITVPALLSLPNSLSASRAYDITLVRLNRTISFLSTLSVAMYASTLLMTRKRHPYLMYAGVLATGSGLWSFRRRRGGRTVEGGFEYLEQENAEIVRERILGLRDWIGLAMTGLGFGIAVVGNYGEGF